MRAEDDYREWLLPGPLPSLVITALIAVFGIAFGAALGALVGWVAFVAGVVVIGTSMVATSPRIVVSRDALQVGRARLPRTVIAEVEALDSDAARDARGVHADARDYLVLRTLATSRAVRITLDDPTDPHPHWLVSSRNPTALQAALQ